MSNEYKVFDDGGLSALTEHMKATRTKANSNEAAVSTLGEDLAELSSEVVTALGNKQDKLTFDTTPTSGSTNPVTSGGVKTVLDGKADSGHSHDKIVSNDGAGFQFTRNARRLAFTPFFGDNDEVTSFALGESTSPLDVVYTDSIVLDGVSLDDALKSKADTGHTHSATEVTFTDGDTFQDKLDSGELKGEKGDTGNGFEQVTTSGDGAAYTATVSNITALTAGVSFTMIPHTASTSTTATLNVNGLGAKTLRRPLSANNTTAVAPTETSWLTANKPVRVMYNGTYWLVMDMARPYGPDLYGRVAIANGGTPEVSTSDNGKFLRVVDGAWAAVSISNAEEASF